MTSVLITGAARGVGRGLAVAFASAGWDVAITARELDGARAVHDEIRRSALDVPERTMTGRTTAGLTTTGRTMAMAADVTVAGELETAIDRAAAEFGGLGAFVHNAVSRRSSEECVLETATLELWEEHASVSLRGLWRGVRAAHRYLADSAGAVLVLTSPAGINGSANNGLYGAVKAGQRAFVRSLAREWGPEGIRVNGLAPLAMTEALRATFEHDPAREAQLARIVPLGRFGDPVTDIGPAAIFLCGADAGYVTGQNLVVSGGRLTST